MANEQLPETYAQAIYQQATEDWLTPLKKLAEYLKPADVEQLDNPGLPFSKKQEIINRVVTSSSGAQVKNFISLLATKNDVHFLPTIISEFDRFATRGPLHNAARVTSAVALTDSEKKALEAKLRGRYGSDLGFDYRVDPEILGGVVVRVGDKVIDGSVSGKLAALRDKLK